MYQEVLPVPLRSDEEEVSPIEGQSNGRVTRRGKSKSCINSTSKNKQEAKKIAKYVKAKKQEDNKKLKQLLKPPKEVRGQRDILTYTPPGYDPTNWKSAYNQFYKNNPIPSSSVEGHKPLIYSREYAISVLMLEKLHPFHVDKYSEVYQTLLRRLGRRRRGAAGAGGGGTKEGMLLFHSDDRNGSGSREGSTDDIIRDIQNHNHVSNDKNDGFVLLEEHFVCPKPPSKEVLLLAHSDEYLKSLKSAKNLAQLTELTMLAAVPTFILKQGLLLPLLTATGGSVLAPKLALEYGWAINLGGGYHHCSGTQGGGFCIYADINLSINFLRKYHPSLRRIMIIDLDAHQGNGPERAYMDDDDIFILDAYNGDIYPRDDYAKQGIDIAIELASYTKDDEYLQLVEENLREAFERFSPELIIYNAGTDCLEGDPMGALSISPRGIIKRDEMVFRAAFAEQVPIVMLLSGGYKKSNTKVVADSIINLNKKFSLLSRSPIHQSLRTSQGRSRSCSSDCILSSRSQPRRWVEEEFKMAAEVGSYTSIDICSTEE